MSEQVLSVVLVDDHKMVRDGFTQIINSAPLFSVTGEYSYVSMAKQSQVLREADFVITDISMRGENGFNLIEFIHAEGLTCKVVVVSMYENALYLQRAKELKVDGFLNKGDASESLMTALTKIHAGESYFSAELAAKFKEAESALKVYNELFPREKQVFILLAKGFKVKSIAAEMQIAVKTVHTHRLNLYRKFAFHTSFEITQFALKHGILTNADIVDIS